MVRHIPNALTLCNAFVGAFGTYYVLVIDASTGLMWVALAALFDFLDGLTARWFKATSSIGAQLDSLSDVVSFGVLPAMAMAAQTPDAFWVWLLIVPFSALRLAIFNTKAQSTSHFTGLPTPANAFWVTSLPYLNQSDWLTNPYFVAGFVALSCMLLVSKMKLLTFKIKSPGETANRPRIHLLLAVLIGLFIWKSHFVPYIIPVYLVVSVAWHVLQKKAD